MRSFRFMSVVVTLSAAFLAPLNSLADPSVPGFTVQTYAHVTDPMRMSFDPSGIMYVGRDASGSGGTPGQAVKIHRVGLGGSPVLEYGQTIVSDPDAVIFDHAGVVSGAAGSILVGGASGVNGYIGVIRPDQSTAFLFGPTSQFTNPSEMAFDFSGRLVVVDDPTKRVLTSMGAAPTTLFTTALAPRSLAIDAANRIYLHLASGSIQIYDPDGSLADGAFVTGLGSEVPLEMGQGSVIWGTDLYALDNSSGQLLRIGGDGGVTTIGTGFTGTVIDLAFGPDGGLYVSMFAEDRILRIIPEPGTLALLTLGSFLITTRRSRRPQSL